MKAGSELMQSTDDASRCFFEGLREGVIRVQRCSCGAFQLGRIICFSCRASELSWVAACGHGRVHTVAKVRRAGHALFEPMTPFVSGMIELDEGPRLFARGRGEVVARIGDRVRLEVVDTVGIGPAPVFSPVGAS